MKRFIVLTLAAAVTAVVLHGTLLAQDACQGNCEDANAVEARKGLRRRAQTAVVPTSAWHGDYYHSAWGTPVALVVPPTARRQTQWGWGLGNTRWPPIEHQFQRQFAVPSPYPAGRFAPTPIWPTDTDQFGVYYVRGPW